MFLELYPTESLRLAFGYRPRPLHPPSQRELQRVAPVLLCKCLLVLVRKLVFAQLPALDFSILLEYVCQSKLLQSYLLFALLRNMHLPEWAKTTSSNIAKSSAGSCAETEVSPRYEAVE
jgi:hypothetical protein